MCCHDGAGVWSSEGVGAGRRPQKVGGGWLRGHHRRTGD